MLPIDQTHLDYSPFLSALAYFATMENESSCNDEEHLLLLLLLQDMLEELDEMEESVEGFLRKEIKKQRREERCLPSPKNRTSWEEFMDKISTGHFRRMFCMSQDAFDLLCKDVCKKIGEQVFLPAAEIKSSNSERTISRVYGEVKVAITLRMMAGGSYLDLVPLPLITEIQCHWVSRIFDANVYAKNS